MLPFIQRLNRLALGAVLLAPMALHADVIFSNVTGNTPDFDSPTIAFSTEIAEAFTPTRNVLMTSAGVFISDLGAGSGVDLFLYADSSGQPGSEIEQLGSDLNGPSNSYALETANSFTPIDLTAGTQYWLVMTPTDGTSDEQWGDNGSVNVPYAVSVDGGSTWGDPSSFSLQFKIDGTRLACTPEPSSLPLLAGATIGLLLAAHRARRTLRPGSAKA